MIKKLMFYALNCIVKERYTRFRWSPTISPTGPCPFWRASRCSWRIHGSVYLTSAIPQPCRWAQWHLLSSWCHHVHPLFTLPTYWRTSWGWPCAHTWAGRNPILETDTGFYSFAMARVVQTDSCVCVLCVLLSVCCRTVLIGLWYHYAGNTQSTQVGLSQQPIQPGEQSAAWPEHGAPQRLSHLFSQFP